MARLDYRGAWEACLQLLSLCVHLEIVVWVRMSYRLRAHALPWAAILLTSLVPLSGHLWYTAFGMCMWYLSQLAPHASRNSSLLNQEARVLVAFPVEWWKSSVGLHTPGFALLFGIWSVAKLDYSE